MNNLEKLLESTKEEQRDSSLDYLNESAMILNNTENILQESTKYIVKTLGKIEKTLNKQEAKLKLIDKNAKYDIKKPMIGYALISETKGDIITASQSGKLLTTYLNVIKPSKMENAIRLILNTYSKNGIYLDYMELNGHPDSIIYSTPNKNLVEMRNVSYKEISERIATAKKSIQAIAKMDNETDKIKADFLKWYEEEKAKLKTIDKINHKIKKNNFNPGVFIVSKTITSLISLYVRDTDKMIKNITKLEKGK